MKKRLLSLLLAFCLLLTLLPGTVWAQEVLLDSSEEDYAISTYASGYRYNWGQRGVVAGGENQFLYASAFYKRNNVTYSDLAKLAGSSAVSSVPSSALYKKLQSLMESNHDFITSYNGTKSLYQYTDCQNGGGKISSFYSGKLIGPSWDGGWNREHTWPNSKGLGGSDENDIIMLRPTSTSENSSRGNTAYGESAGYYDPNKESKNAYNLHGDVARLMLYVYVRWGNTGKMWGTSGVMENKNVLLKWIEEDPVDTWELGRNDSVESITGTRNVFVDYPELAFVLFGAKIPEDMATPSGEAAKLYPDEPLTWSMNNGTLTISGNGKMDDYVQSGAPWLQDAQSITQVVITQGVRSIGDYAFEGCENLISVTIPTSITSIGGDAFYNCGNLKHVLYLGTDTQWKGISIAGHNECLTLTDLHCEALGDEVYSTVDSQGTHWYCDLCREAIYEDLIIIPKEGWIEEDGSWFFYENNQKICSTWKLDSSGWCYLTEDGSMATNQWIMDSQGWCYVDASGYCVTNCWMQDSSGWCYLNAEGRMATNTWIQDSQGWCYVGADGYCVTNSWMQDSIGWCYLNAEGRMATDTWILDSQGWCYVGSLGYCLTNCWMQDSIGWCYLGATGSMLKSSWVSYNGHLYYVDENGYKVTNTVVRDGYFDETGIFVQTERM